jgi:hypothetical protein
VSFYFNFKIELLCQELHMEYKHACEIEYTNIQIINRLILTNLFFCNLVLQHKYTYKIKMLSNSYSKSNIKLIMLKTIRKNNNIKSSKK